MLSTSVRIGGEQAWLNIKSMALGTTRLEFEYAIPLDDAKVMLKELAEGLDPEVFWQVHRGVIVRASAIARAQRDDMGRITLHLRQRADTLSVSQAYAWRFKPM